MPPTPKSPIPNLFSIFLRKSKHHIHCNIISSYGPSRLPRMPRKWHSTHLPANQEALYSINHFLRFLCSMKANPNLLANNYFSRTKILPREINDYQWSFQNAKKRNITPAKFWRKKFCLPIWKTNNKAIDELA